MSSDPRVRSVTTLSATSIPATPLSEVLVKIGQVAVDVVPRATEATVTLFADDGEVSAVASSASAGTSGTALPLDGAALAAGRSPAREAWRAGVDVTIPDTAAEGPYDAHRRKLAAQGIRSTRSLPIGADDDRVGALSLYGPEPGELVSDDDAPMLERVSHVAATLVTNSVTYWRQVELVEQLQTALRSRAVIDQAKGIVMAKTPGLGPDGAFDTLRRASQRENVKVAVIAQRIVDAASQPNRLVTEPEVESAPAD